VPVSPLMLCAAGHEFARAFDEVSQGRTGEDAETIAAAASAIRRAIAVIGKVAPRKKSVGARSDRLLKSALRRE